MADQSRLTWALILSLLLHGILLSVLTILRGAPLNFATPKFVDVDVLPLPAPKPAAPPPARPAPPAPQAQPAPPPPAPLERPQIVSPPDAGQEKEPENTRLLSDRNNRVEQEQIKRGEPLPADPDAKPKPPQPAAVEKQEPPAPKPQEPPAPKPQPRAATRPQPAPAPKAAARPAESASRRAAPPEQLAALPRIDQLLPSAGDLIRQGVIKPEAGPDSEPGSDGRAQPPAGDQHASVQRNDLLRHGDPWRKGSGGSLDFLPAVRDGDITMLNTKADQFAPFVRRVAVRVFETFWIQLRRSIGRGMMDSIEEGAVVEAVMDRQGQLIDFKTKERSANAALATDRNLQSSVQEAFFDRNPPSGAEANDGNIHFLFQVRVSLIADPARGVVGYRALMGAGLL